jgi:hypothetical protein
MRRSSWVVGFLVLLSLFAVSGCYTVLTHPTGDSVVYEGDYYYKTCADCHADASYYHPYYTYGMSNYRWRDYYGYPWWYDSYWWWDPYDHAQQGEGPEVREGMGHLWGSGGWPSGGWGFGSPSPGGSGGQPGEQPPLRRPLRIRPTEKEKTKAKEEPTPPPKQETKKEEKKPDQPLEPEKERPAPQPVRPTPTRGK